MEESKGGCRQEYRTREVDLIRDVSKTVREEDYNPNTHSLVPMRCNTESRKSAARYVRCRGAWFDHKFGPSQIFRARSGAVQQIP